MDTTRPEISARPGGPLLVQSRLRPPLPRVPWVPRPRLIERLREGAGRPLTVVSAPAGFGKTTLLAQWAQSDGGRTPFAWVTLAEDVQDPTTFLLYVIEALRSVDPAIGRQAQRRLGGPEDDPMRLAMPALLNDLERLSDRVVLVLDGFDALHEPGTRHRLAFLLENLAGPLHIVVATRSVPLLPIARLRAQGELFELGGDDLRFSLEDAGMLLGGKMGLDVPEDELRALLDATEGWAAGVYLAGMYLSGEPGRSASAFGGTHRHVAEFLRDEVLHRQPEPVREFLLRTSILDRLSPGLCEALIEGDGAGLMLADLERSNLFVVPLDDEAQWFRYHLLFRDMLRAEAARLLPAELPELHRRASRWHRRNGTAVEAVRHAASAGDDALTAELIKANWVVQARSGHRATVWSWLERLPWDVTRSDPHLCAIAAYLLTYDGEFDAAKVWLSRIPDRIPPPASPLPDGFSTVGSLRDLVLAHPIHNVGSSLRFARRTLELELPGSPWRSASEVAVGIDLYFSGQRAEARHHLDRARVEATTAPRPGTELLALTYLSLVEHDVGDPAEADTLAMEARRLLDVYDVVDSPMLAPLFVVSAAALGRRGDRDGAERDLAEAARLGAVYGRTLVPALTSLLTAKLRLSWGDVAACQANLREAHTSLNACSDPGALREEFAALDARTRPRASRHDLPEALTASEVAVLRLLATDLSLGEIAARLFVSINTIKTHTRHIYQKLQSPSRRAAVERSRAIGLI